jgi:hypothetical protein
MPLKNFSPQFTGTQKKTLVKQIQKFEKLLNALSNRDITDSVLETINAEVEKVNQAESASLLATQMTKSLQKILKIIEKEMNWVAKNHYRNMWLAIGMAAFGIPFGLVFSTALDNYAFIGIGLPIGMGIGIAIGTKKDTEAFEEGRQLDVEL